MSCSNNAMKTMALHGPETALADLFDTEGFDDDEYAQRIDLFANEGKGSFLDYCTNAKFPWVEDYLTAPLTYAGEKTEDSDQSYELVETRDGKRLVEPKNGLAYGRIKSRSQLQKLSDLVGNTQQAQIDVFFIRQQNSYSRMLVSKHLFEDLLLRWAIFDSIKGHLLSFGFKIREDDIGPPRCRFHVTNAPNVQLGSMAAAPAQIECAYGLRYVELAGQNETEKSWRVRQTAVYHKVDLQANRETLLLVSAPQSMEQKIENYVKAATLPKRATFCDLHRALIQISLKNWRWYLKSLISQVTEQTSRIIAATVGKESEPTLIDFQISFEDRQILKVIEDKVLDLLIIFDAMTDTIGQIRRVSKQIPSQCQDDFVIPTSTDLEDNILELQLHRKKSEILLVRIQGTASVLSNLLEHENERQTQINGVSLKQLAEESRQENVIMRGLTEKSTRDAAAVKAITVITIIYLPTTVVASFFSTQFVFQEPALDGTPKLSFASNWWMYVAISIPLTIATIAIWYAWISWPWQYKTWSLRIRADHLPRHKKEDIELPTPRLSLAIKDERNRY